MGASSGAGGHHYSQTEIRALSGRRNGGVGGAPRESVASGIRPAGHRPEDAGADWPTRPRGGTKAKGAGLGWPGDGRGGGETPEGKRRGRTWVFRASL